MRKQLCDALISRASNPDVVFLTGDLGFMALEPLQSLMGERFINAGVAEQNMVSVAAALASLELEVWVYSIAPFLYARPFEQIRNDVAFHDLPVKLIGNGGGYGYGVMGPTHHAIDDYGVLLTLPNMSVYIPVFDEDIDAVVKKAGNNQHPCYLRMGKGEPPKGYKVPDYAPWRQLCHGKGPVVIAVGPLAGSYIESLENTDIEIRPKLWAVAEMPISMSPPPDELIFQIKSCNMLCIAEEHVRHGGFGSDMLLYLSDRNIYVEKIKYLYARAHHFDRYGSQSYLRKKSQLDVASLQSLLSDF